MHLKRPTLDVPTRWSSTFDMLQRLLEHKNFCIENLNESLLLSSDEWIEIQEIVSALSPLHNATLKLQEQLFLGDFYKLWIDLKVQLRFMDTETSRVIYSYLENRAPQILNNDAINAAVFLDPRLRRLLPSQKKGECKKHLKKTRCTDNFSKTGLFSLLLLFLIKFKLNCFIFQLIRVIMWYVQSIMKTAPS